MDRMKNEPIFIGGPLKKACTQKYPSHFSLSLTINFSPLSLLFPLIPLSPLLYISFSSLLSSPRLGGDADTVAAGSGGEQLGGLGRGGGRGD